MTIRRALAWLPREVLVVYAATFVNRSGAMALPFFVLYRTDVRGDAPAEAAALLGAYGAGALVAGPLGGWASGRLGPRRVMLASLVASALLVSCVALSTSRPAAAALVVAWAIATEAFRPASALVIGDAVAPERHREAFAGLRLAVNLGMTVGPAAGSMLFRAAPAALFAVDAVSSVIAAALVAAARGSRAHTPSAAPSVSSGADAPLDRRAIAVHLVATWLVALVAFQSMSTLAIYMTRDLELDASTYGLAFAFSGLLITAFELPLTLAVRGRSNRMLVSAGAALTGAGFAALGSSPSAVGVFLSTVVWTFGEMLLGPAAFARTIELGCGSRRGVVMGLYNAAWSAAFAIGPWLGTQSLAKLGGSLHWPLVGGVGAVASALFFASGRSVGTGPRDQRGREHS